jgi:hypothetical protein
MILFILFIIILFVLFVLLKNYNETFEQIGYDLAMNPYPFMSYGGENIKLLNDYIHLCYGNNKMIKNLNKNIHKNIAKNQNIWSAKIDLESNDYALEYYFYIFAPWSDNYSIDEYWDLVKNTFEKTYVLKEKNIIDHNNLFAVSLDIPKNNIIENIDCYYHDINNLDENPNIYDTNKICFQQNNNILKYKNKYIWQYSNINNSFQENIHKFPNEIFILQKYKSITLAYKRNNKGVYYSGISLNDLLFLCEKLKKFMVSDSIKSLNKFINPLIKRFDTYKYLLFDIGYDFKIVNKKPVIIKIAFYSWL